MPTNSKMSRRTWLRKVGLLTTAAGLPLMLASASEAAQKVSKSVVHYRDYPKEMQMCGMCKFFEGGGMNGRRWNDARRNDGRRNDGRWYDGRRV